MNLRATDLGRGHAAVSRTNSPPHTPAPRRRSGRRPGPADVRRLLTPGDTDDDKGPQVYAQPILDLVSGTLSGYEALARFRRFPAATPDDWFAAAHRGGVGAQLEAYAVAKALELGATRPAGTVLSVNVSPSVIDSPELQAVLPHDLTGLQFEVTEHELADDGAALVAALERLRRRGARIAVDDVGAGFAGFKRLVTVAPDVLKLDRALVTGVSREPRKVALVEAIVHFGARTGARVCAEGLETVEDLAAVTDLAVGLGQGWLIGRPTAEFAAVDPVARQAWQAGQPGAPRCPGVPGLPSRPGGIGPRQLHDLAEVLESLSEVRTLDAAAAVLAGSTELLGCQAIGLAVVEQASTAAGQSVLRLLTPEGALGGAAERPGGPGWPWPLCRAPIARQVVDERSVGQVLAGSVAPDTVERTWLTATGSRSMVLFPLVSAGRAVGLLVCGRRHEHLWSRAELRPARTVAAAAGAVIAALTPPGFPTATRTR
ncbi:EAL domain-containing protein [Cryptosporangium aurantiacum]|uniref:EAL domain, c-di-GMP-specific phosphodiesterase class I (Or its enzymatically inactive variant) n=1 Tax=Cryptosporangium aurantiacum TaxID=134849 RepID=A0A1M7I1D8_9ACTN|nr:EAL domain-containing protein [Cryptosporangium aurantiacum]SHM34582.1 EAL domain, c-di-GMP-specific phosphodiesterase class I (or its enzymatically inactive variant) [Cryptosporangium aurantiacum]